MMTQQSEASSVDVDIVGMTCTTCAQRIERKLNKLPGVEASVNYATESAHITFTDPVAVQDLLNTIEAAGYQPIPPTEPATEAEEAGEREVHDLRRRFVISATLAVPVAVISMVTALQFPGWQWVVAALTTPVVFWGGWPFHRAAWLNARHGTATMDTLISIGTLVAYVWSVWALIWGGAGAIGVTHSTPNVPSLYFEVAAVVPVFILLGRWFEAKAKRSSSSALRALIALSVNEATVIIDGRERLVPAEQLQVGDRFVVRPGERVATDGFVVDGQSAIDMSLVTGESIPVDVAPGDAVVGSTINEDGRLIVEATRVGSDTTVAQISRLVMDAQSGKAPVQRLADRVAAIFVPIVLVIAVVTFAAWLLVSREPQAAFTAAVAVLVIACPCALGLATPTALLVGTGRGARLGIIIRGPQVLEDTRRIDTIVFDKTGTLTTGELAISRVTAVDGDTNELLRMAAAAEQGSEHPVARAIVAAVDDVPSMHGFVNHRGQGVRAVVGNTEVLVGKPHWIAEELKVDLPTVGGIAVAWAGAYRGSIEVTDGLRPSSAHAIELLKGMGLTPVLLTGDTRDRAAEVATDVGIRDVHADVVPAEKAAVIVDLQHQGRVVAMVGDGVNDAAALASSDLGIAMGTGTDVAIEASDLTIMRPDVLAVVDAIRLSRRTLGTIKGNLFWAFAYNVAMIPIAAAGLLNPMWAAGAMAASSVFVVLNSLRLKRFRSVAA